MANKHEGEADLWIGGRDRTVKLNLRAIAKTGAETGNNGLELLNNTIALQNPAVFIPMLAFGLQEGEPDKRERREITVNKVYDWFSEGHPDKDFGEWMPYICEAIATAVKGFILGPDANEEAAPAADPPQQEGAA